jgi:hypothetical protein
VVLIPELNTYLWGEMSYSSESVKRWRKRFKQKDPKGYANNRRLEAQKYRNNPEVWAKEVKRAWAAVIKRLYHLTIQEWEDLFASQNGVCALCGLPPYPNERLAVDHNHTTNKVRGLVHRNPCNLVIGYVEKYPTHCIDAVKYLQKYVG